MNLISYEFGVSSGSASPTFINSRLAGGVFSPASFVANGGGFALGSKNYHKLEYSFDLDILTWSAIKVDNLQFDVACQPYSNLKFYIGDRLYFDADIDADTIYTLNVNEALDTEWVDGSKNLKFSFTLPETGYGFNPVASGELAIGEVGYSSTAFIQNGDDIELTNLSVGVIDDPYFDALDSGGDLLIQLKDDYGQNAGIDNLYILGDLTSANQSNYGKSTKYHSVALFAGPSPATGAHIIDGVTQLNQIRGVISVSDNFDISLVDVLQFGQMAPLARVPLTTPTVGVEFTYYHCDNTNESHIGMITDGSEPMLARVLDRTEEDRNYFIGVAPNGYEITNFPFKEVMKTVGLGNGTITNYTLSASVGGYVESTVSFECFNYVIYDKGYGKVPAVNRETGDWDTDEEFELPIAVYDESKPIKQGDITINFDEITTKLGERLTSDNGFSCYLNLQSFNLDIPITRTGLERLGSTYAASKEPDFPIKATLTLETSSKELVNGNLVDILNSCSLLKLNSTITLSKCGEIQSQYSIRGMVFDSENSTLSTTSGRTSTIQFSLVIGGVGDVDNNIYLTTNQDRVLASNGSILASDITVLASE